MEAREILPEDWGALWMRTMQAPRRPSMKKRVNVTQTLLPKRERFHEYVDRIFDSGWLTNRGELVRELEVRLAEYLGVRHVVLVTNATLALQVAYKAMGLEGEMITSPFTFIATASSAVWAGLDVVFADIDQASWNIDPGEIERKITKRTAAILPVHVFGNPSDVEAIEALASKHKIPVIYDAAHAFGVRYKDECIMNRGDISILSFHATKLFHTIEGGALIINDDALCTKVRKMINFGITGPGSVECLGINAKMNEFQAAMGLCLLDNMQAVIEYRRQLSSLYDAMLGPHITKQRWSDQASCNHAYYPALFESEAMVQAIQAALNSQNIFPRQYFYPSLDSLPFLAEQQECVTSRDIAGRILCLPLYAGMSEHLCKQISSIIRNVMEN